MTQILERSKELEGSVHGSDSDEPDDVMRLCPRDGDECVRECNKTYEVGLLL